MKGRRFPWTSKMSRCKMFSTTCCGSADCKPTASGGRFLWAANLPIDSRNIIIRTLRLNQVRSTDAANFLSAQGAETQLPITRVTIQTVGQGNAARDVEIREPDIKAIGAREGTGPLAEGTVGAGRCEAQFHHFGGRPAQS